MKDLFNQMGTLLIQLNNQPQINTMVQSIQLTHTEFQQERHTRWILYSLPKESHWTAVLISTAIKTANIIASNLTRGHLQDALDDLIQINKIDMLGTYCHIQAIVEQVPAQPVHKLLPFETALSAFKSRLLETSSIPEVQVLYYSDPEMEQVN
eukprot:12307621-Ditylum_brightwellii.AAC.1